MRRPVAKTFLNISSSFYSLWFLCIPLSLTSFPFMENSLDVWVSHQILLGGFWWSWSQRRTKVYRFPLLTNSSESALSVLVLISPFCYGQSTEEILWHGLPQEDLHPLRVQQHLSDSWMGVMRITRRLMVSTFINHILFTSVLKSPKYEFISIQH